MQCVNTPVNKAFFVNDRELVLRAGNNQAAAPIRESERIKINNVYWEQGIPGAIPEIVVRQSVVEMLHEAVGRLPDGYGVVVYDGFRTLVTQNALFLRFKAAIAEKNPSWTEEKLISETKKLVALPGDPAIPGVMPHNSGGAIDLTLISRGELCEMGTLFDDCTPLAQPDYFEAPYMTSAGISPATWEKARSSRRILFNAMTASGFTVDAYEWWHFDFGNAPWAVVTSKDVIYHSMEGEYAAYKG